MVNRPTITQLGPLSELQNEWYHMVAVGVGKNVNMLSYWIEPKIS